MSQHPHQFGGFRAFIGLGEHRLTHQQKPNRVAAKTEDEQMLEGFEADEARREEPETVQEAASGVNFHRNKLIRDLDKAMKLNVCIRYIPWFSAFKRARNADWVVSQESERLAKEACPDARLRNRFLAFVFGEDYRSALFLTQEQNIKKTLISGLRNGINADVRDAEKGKADDQRWLDIVSGSRAVEVQLGNRTPGQIQDMFARRRTHVTLLPSSAKEKGKWLDALATSEGKADRMIEKKNLVMPPALKEFKREEIILREMLEAAELKDVQGRDITGDVMEELIIDNRRSGKKLIRILENYRDVPDGVLQALLQKTTKIRDKGWIFSSEQRYVNALDGVRRAMNYQPIAERLRYVREAPDEEVLQDLKVLIKPPGEPARKMVLSKRSGNYAKFVETRGSRGDRFLCAINTNTLKVLYRGPDNRFRAPVTLDDTSFEIL